MKNTSKTDHTHDAFVQKMRSFGLTLSEGRDSIRFCDSYSRLPTLIDLSWRMEPHDWLTIFGEEWEGFDNIGLHLVDLLDTPFGLLLDAPLEWRDAMMTKSERTVLTKLPDMVTVYRGCRTQNKRGMSWSLDPAVAATFPLLNRYQGEGQPLLIRATVKRDDILAIKLGREEQEVVAQRPKIVAISYIRVPLGA